MTKKGTYSREDIIKVLTKKPMITSTVKSRLEKLNKKYKDMSRVYLGQLLLKMLEAKEIEGEKDLETGFYFWRKKEE